MSDIPTQEEHERRMLQVQLDLVRERLDELTTRATLAGFTVARLQGLVDSQQTRISTLESQVGELMLIKDSLAAGLAGNTETINEVIRTTVKNVNDMQLLERTHTEAIEQLIEWRIDLEEAD